MDLPAEIRATFDNNPATFLDYAQDPENNQALMDMGLIEPDPETTLNFKGD